MIEAWEEEFLQLQSETPFFVFECFATAYLLLSLGIISEKFLMPSLENISKKYNLSATTQGVLIAFGIAIPELTVTMLAFQRHGIKMTEFGLATVFGSVVFVITFVPGIAYLVNYGCRNQKPPATAEEKAVNAQLTKAFLRDMSFLIIALVFFYFFMAEESLTLGQCFFLLALFAAYVILLCVQQYLKNKEQEKDDEARKKQDAADEELRVGAAEHSVGHKFEDIKSYSETTLGLNLSDRAEEV